MTSETAREIIKGMKRRMSLIRLRGERCPNPSPIEREALAVLAALEQANKHLPELRRRSVDQSVRRALLSNTGSGSRTGSGVRRCSSCGKPAMAGSDLCYTCESD